MRAQKNEKNFDYQYMDSTFNEIQIWNNFTALFISKVTNLPQKELRLHCKLNFISFLSERQNQPGEQTFFSEPQLYKVHLTDPSAVPSRNKGRVIVRKYFIENIKKIFYKIKVFFK